MTEDSSIDLLVDHLFRHQAGRIVSTLTRLFGLENLDLAEDVVQETLLKALQQWSYRGVPRDPAAWITQVARNRALDILRREARFRRKAEQLALLSQNGKQPEIPGEAIFAADEVRDDELRMIFACCHPALPREARVALTLKTVGGFGVSEIARAFVVPEPTVAQRLVRAKRKIREEGIPFVVPEPEELPARLDSALDVLYLLFSEGYNAHEGEDLVRHDLCAEAIRLTSILVGHPAGKQPKVHALLALMLLQAARLPGRVDGDGNLLLLAEQDRSRWDRGMIHAAYAQLDLAASGDQLSEYHLQAGIAAEHAAAPSYEATNWELILFYYDELAARNPSPIILLNRAVAVAQLHGTAAGLAELERVATIPQARGYYLLPATFADLYARNNQPALAAQHYREALRLTGNEVERRFLLKRLA